MIYRIVILSFISLMAISCKKSLREVQVLNNDNDIVSTYMIDQDSLIQGRLIKKIKSQSIEIEENYLNNLLHGERIIYYSDKSIHIKENYLHGVIDGKYLEYHPNGQILIEAQYKNGIMSGILKKYYDNGQVEEIVTIKNNEENGPFKEYYPDGTLHWEGTYLNGDNEFGLLSEYDENGELVNKLMCDSLFICRAIWTKEKGNIK